MKARPGILLGLGLALSAAPAADLVSLPPSKVEHAVGEAELATVRLTPKAEQRLGIDLVEVTRKKVAISRLFGGDVLIPLAPEGATPTQYFPLTSSTPEELLRLSDQQAIADGETEKAKVQLESAQRTYNRAQKLTKGDAGSIRAMEDAEAQVRLAEKAVDMATSRRSLLGAPVSEAIRGGRIWVRVPVYAGELKLIDLTSDAGIGEIASRPGDATLVGRPVSAPSSASAANASVDLFYEVIGADNLLRPGQRVSVRVRLKGEEESLVVPWASILNDIHGNAWVYECIGPQTFSRQRVQVTRIVEEDAVLTRGPKLGARIVAAGAAELFGTEFGAGK